MYKIEYLLIIILYYLYDNLLAKKFYLVQIWYTYTLILFLIYSITVLYKGYITFL